MIHKYTGKKITHSFLLDHRIDEAGIQNVLLCILLHVAMNKNIAITVFQRVANGLGVHGILVIRHMDAYNDIFQRTVNGLLGSMAFL